jgi:DNA-binding response OmpR family regulator
MALPHIVLIVDDEPVGRETLEALLLAEGYQLAFAANGPEALAQAAALNPDVILLDVMMPGMDGFEVCRRLRASPAVAEVPVIFVTALDDRDARLRGIEAGADEFVIKSYDRAELRLRVRTIIRLNRYRRLHAERLRLAWAIEQADDGYVILEGATASPQRIRARGCISGSQTTRSSLFLVHF